MSQPSFAVARRLAVLLIALLVWITACSSGGCEPTPNRYLLRITPRGDSLERSLTIERFQGHEDSITGMRTPQDVQEINKHLFSEYGASVDTAFHGSFKARKRFAEVPDDIGNRGVYRVTRNPLGRCWTWRESFRGMDDPEAWVAREYAVADSAAHHVAEWLAWEMATRPEYARISATLERDLRTQARTIVAMTAIPRGAENPWAEAWFYDVVERRPLLGLAVTTLAGFEDGSDGSSSWALARARDDLARRMGLDAMADRDRVLGFLASPQHAAASYERFQRAAGPPKFDVDAASSVLGNALGASGSNAEADEVTVELALPDAPDAHNGAWDSTAHVVRWSARMPLLTNMDGFAPHVWQAVWAAPDTAAQVRLFGRVAVSGSALIEYDQRYQAWDMARRAEWDRMVLALRPGHTEPLERFRFGAGRGGAQASEPDVAEDQRKLLHNALEPPARPKPALPHVKT